MKAVCAMPCRLLAVIVVGLALGLGACTQTDKRAAPNPISGSPNAQPIDGNQLTQIQPGMTKGQVRNMVGPPATENTYWTLLSWMPGEFNDSLRTTWQYDGLGSVTFTEHRYGGAPARVRDVDLEKRPRRR